MGRNEYGTVPMDVAELGAGGLLVLAPEAQTPATELALSVMPDMIGMVAAWVNATSQRQPRAWALDHWGEAMDHLPFTIGRPQTPIRISFNGPLRDLPGMLLSRLAADATVTAPDNWQAHLAGIAPRLRAQLAMAGATYPVLWAIIRVTGHSAWFDLWQTDLRRTLPAGTSMEVVGRESRIAIDQDVLHGRWDLDMAALDNPANLGNLRNLIGSASLVGVERTRTFCRLSVGTVAA